MAFRKTLNSAPKQQSRCASRSNLLKILNLPVHFRSNEPAFQSFAGASNSSRSGRIFRIGLALAVSLTASLGLTSCSTNHTVGYLFVTSSYFNEISGYKVDNNFGELHTIPKMPISSGGINPTRAVVANGGQFLYVLNGGCGGNTAFTCPEGTSATAPNISLFTIGGHGSLSFQRSYSGQGSGPISILTDASGKYLFELDSLAPDPTTCVGYNPTIPATACGDITAFAIDPNTGRLSLVTNQQVKDSSGQNLTYFPIGSRPINFALYNNTYLYTIEKGSGTALDPVQAVFVYQLAGATGQLTLTQNTPIPTNAQNLTYIYASSAYIYLLDAGNGTTPGLILPFTSAASGALQSLAGGAVANTGQTANPSVMIVDSQNKFLYVANAGPNLSPSSPSSTVSAFFITPGTGQLVPLALGSGTGPAQSNIPFGSGTDPRCILQDPSNQYLYTANFGSDNITGAVVNSQAGTLTNLRKSTSFTTPRQPTWCVVSGTLF